MQVPVERSRNASRHEQQFWLEFLVILGLVLVALAGGYLILGLITTTMVFSVALALLLALSIR